jgi:predicted Rdx family selenoprotein
MSGAQRWSRPVLIYLGMLTAFFLAQQLGRQTHLFTDVLTPPRVLPFGSLAKLAPQFLGSVFAGLCAGRYEKGNSARRAWTLMSAWLGCWFLGQVVLSGYGNLLHRAAPIPSLGDVFFIAGYVFVIVALFAFISAYRASGFAVGSTRELVSIALGACAVFGVVGYEVLVAAATAKTPGAERLVTVGYPVLDLIALIPAIVLFRITIAFRGGQVWRFRRRANGSPKAHFKKGMAAIADGKYEAGHRPS